ncbi:NSUN2 [Symbiodinium pilosum]|uniref:NSUN2 protein n=1 Tax=Symbiodinium pilosum TaxID=2952 RepID=A0A812U5B5_SYMPI|nr:NSUN2 [Symbiodinium pilosum]
MASGKGKSGPSRPHVAVPRAVLLTKEDLENFHHNVISREEVSNLRHETLPRLSRASARMLTWCTLLLLSTACIYAFRSSLLPDHFFKDSFAKDAMRYGSVGLLTWMALADTARTVWKKKSLWIMVYRFTGVVLAVSLMEFIFLSDPGSINPLAFAQLTSFLTVFVSLLLGFFLSTSIRRWVACVNGFLTLFDIIRALQMQLITLGIPRQNAVKALRFGLLSGWLSCRLLHVESRVGPEQHAARDAMWQEILTSKDLYLSLTEAEFQKLQDVQDPCPHLWLWIASFMGRLASDGEIPPMASPTYGRIVALANDAQNALKEIRICGEVQIPYLYTHTLAAIVHVNNILSAISMGLTLGSCLAALLTSVDSRLTLYGIDSRPSMSASATFQILLIQSLKCFCAPLLYQACLEIALTLCVPFGPNCDEAEIPGEQMVRHCAAECIACFELAASPPHWSAPAFKTGISHVPDIERTKAQVRQSG